MVISSEDVEKFNSRIQQWGRGVLSELIAAAPRDTGELRKSIKLRFKKDSGGIINVVIFPIARHGLILDIGKPFPKYKGWFSNILNAAAQDLAEILGEFAALSVAKQIRFPAGNITINV